MPVEFTFLDNGYTCGYVGGGSSSIPRRERKVFQENTGKRSVIVRVSFTTSLIKTDRNLKYPPSDVTHDKT